MTINLTHSQSGFFNPRVLLAFALCSVGVFLAMLSFAATSPSGMTGSVGKSLGNSVFGDKHADPLSGNPNATGMSLAPAAEGGWSIVTSPNATPPPGNNKLRGVTCVSASDCWAVGGNGFQTLIERWDGTSWAIVSSPNTSATQANHLNGVTCVSASDCWAVGYLPEQPNAHPSSDAHRALERDLVDHRYLA